VDLISSASDLALRPARTIGLTDAEELLSETNSDTQEEAVVERTHSVRRSPPQRASRRRLDSRSSDRQRSEELLDLNRAIMLSMQQLPVPPPAPSSTTLNEESVESLAALGFPRAACASALTRCNGDLSQAADYLLTNGS
jgi:hypothetical protein